MMKMEELPCCSFLTAATARSGTGLIPAEKCCRTGDAVTTGEPLKPRSLWEAASPPQQEQKWKEAFEARQYQSEDHVGLPEFVFFNSWQLGRVDDDAVSDLNSEADLEDEDCLPEATIQVLEAVFGVVPLDDDEDQDDDHDEDEHFYNADKDVSLSSAAISTKNESSSSFSFSLASLDLSPLPAIQTCDKQQCENSEPQGVQLPNVEYQVLVFNPLCTSMDDRQSQNTETEEVHLPDATFQVVKSLFASLDNLDNLSKTSYASTYADSLSPVITLQNVTAATPGVLLFTAVKESIAHGGCEFILPHLKLTPTVG